MTFWHGLKLKISKSSDFPIVLLRNQQHGNGPSTSDSSSRNWNILNVLSWFAQIHGNSKKLKHVNVKAETLKAWPTTTYFILYTCIFGGVYFGCCTTETLLIWNWGAYRSPEASPPAIPGASAIPFVIWPQYMHKL